MFPTEAVSVIYSSNLYSDLLGAEHIITFVLYGNNGFCVTAGDELAEGYKLWIGRTGFVVNNITDNNNEALVLNVVDMHRMVENKYILKNFYLFKINIDNNL